jgi:hypothetical protein
MLLVETKMFHSTMLEIPYFLKKEHVLSGLWKTEFDE